MFYREPAVERLPFHLPGEHTVFFDEHTTLDDVISRPNIEKTKLTEWMRANALYEDARALTYNEFPMKWVWHNKEKQWHRRKTGKCIGRMYFAHPSSGEKYYLRLLLNVVKGATSFSHIRTMNGTTHPTFKAACYALGLLDGDKEWTDCLSEAANWASGDQLRQLFATMLVHCEVVDPIELWRINFTILTEDIPYKLQRRLEGNTLNLTEEQISSYALLDIETVLKPFGKSLSNIHGMPTPNRSLLKDINNNLLAEEKGYNIMEERMLHEHYLSGLNDDQLIIYNSIVDSVLNNKSKTIFVNGHGGTGKTFLWKAIIHRMRSEGRIVLPVASSGIASLLLPGGRTAHSRFHIPLNANGDTSCDIRHGTQLAELILKTDLIIWDEAPMANKFCFESLDKSLKDILQSKSPDSEMKPFGGITTVLGGDFRQILPVVPKGGKNDIINASITSSYLWDFFEIYKLYKNMRLLLHESDNISRQSVLNFDKWLLSIGDGKQKDWVKEDFVNIPDDIIIMPGEDPIATIVDATYSEFQLNYSDSTYLEERAILCPKNDTVRQINEFMLDKLQEQSMTYYSFDSICKASFGVRNEDILYPTEFLNTLKFTGVPNHELRLKIGVPVMLMRNLNQACGLCNGTRLIITHMGKWFVQAKVFSGKNKGDTVLIPRIDMTPNESRWPFKMKRRQLPLTVCFAMTINKSQGQSFKQVGLFLPKQVFTHGQLYVALSRVTSRNGLKILNLDEEAEDASLVKNIVYKEIFSAISYLN